MIRQEFYKVREDNVQLYKTYSDNATKYIKQVETGRIYKEAIDVYPIRYTYIEVDEPQPQTLKLDNTKLEALKQKLMSRGTK